MTQHMKPESFEEFARLLMKKNEVYNPLLLPPPPLSRIRTKQKVYEMLADPNVWTQHSQKVFHRGLNRWVYCMLGALMQKHGSHNTNNNSKEFNKDLVALANAIRKTFDGQTLADNRYSPAQVITAWNDMAHRDHKEVIEVLMVANV